ncbi:MAG: sigma-70 family RNA polymerase sigma factor [Fimbriimonadales bacterium]
MVSWDDSGRDVKELVGMAQQGDDHAAERLLQLYRPLVLSVVRGFYLPGSESEDLQQIGMIALWGAILRFDCTRNTSFGAFARLCVRRQILSALKQAQRIPPVIFTPIGDGDSPVPWLEQIGDPAPHPLEQLIEREQSLVLDDRFYAQLSPMETQVLHLFAQQMTYRQIAHHLGCSFKAVDNALSRIRKKARQYLKYQQGI